MEPTKCPIDDSTLKEISKKHYKRTNGHFFRYAITDTVALIRVDSNGNDTEEIYPIPKEN